MAGLGAVDAARRVDVVDGEAHTGDSGGPRKARLPVSGRMPPTLNESALVAPAAHLSSREAAGADADGEVSSVGAARLDVLVVAGAASARVGVVAARDEGEPQGSAQSDRGRQPPEPPGGGGGSIHVGEPFF